MFDKDRYENIKSKKNQLSEKYKELNTLQQDIYEIKEDIRKTCKHDLLLVYDVIDVVNYNDTQKYLKSQCLLCDETNKLLYSESLGEGCYYRYYSKKRVNNDRIIDVTKIVPEECRNYYSHGKNDLVIEAQSVLDEVLSNNINITKEEIEEAIKTRLINYCEKMSNLFCDDSKVLTKK